MMVPCVCVSPSAHPTPQPTHPNTTPTTPGHGVYTCADGDRYEGGWANDKRHGQGVMVYLSEDGATKEKYEGEW